jgi:hypothetical protein
MRKDKGPISPDERDDQVSNSSPDEIDDQVSNVSEASKYSGIFRFKYSNGIHYNYPFVSRGPVSDKIKEEFEDNKLTKGLGGSIKDLEIPKFEISENTAFSKVVPKAKSEGEEVKQRVVSGSSNSQDDKTKIKGELPANHDGNPDPVDVFSAVRSGSSNDIKRGGVVGGSSNGVGSSNGNGARVDLKNSGGAPVVRSSKVLVNKSTQTTSLQGNSPLETLVPASAPSSPRAVKRRKEITGPTKS